SLVEVLTDIADLISETGTTTIVVAYDSRFEAKIKKESSYLYRRPT
ncbi:unnamed protein product, partial [Fusarium graminearum]